MTNLRDRVLAGEILSGVFCELPAPQVVEIAGYAGWDFAVVDCEHGPIALSALPEFARAGDAAGIPVVVRVPENNAAAIQHALDSGAAGVLTPQVGSFAQAETAVRAARHYPEGRRGVNPFVRAAGYSSRAASLFADGRGTLCCVQIESMEAVGDVDRIAALPGLDLMFIGPYDLSQSLGIPGEIADARIFEAGKKIVKAARAHGKAVGVFVTGTAAAERWKDTGATLIGYSIDAVLLLEAFQAARAGLAKRPNS